MLTTSLSLDLTVLLTAPVPACTVLSFAALVASVVADGANETPFVFVTISAPPEDNEPSPVIVTQIGSAAACPTANCAEAHRSDVYPDPAPPFPIAKAWFVIAPEFCAEAEQAIKKAAEAAAAKKRRAIISYFPGD
jgi:hypothetical protein